MLLMFIRLGTAKKRISEPEDQSIETSKTEIQRAGEKTENKTNNKEHLRTVGYF